MPIDLYVFSGSPPCRATLLAAKVIGVELNVITLDFMKKEHLSPEFIKINPQHILPTLVDNGFVLWESRAITTYLQNQYGKSDSLYPKDPKKRAVVDQRLYFDVGTLFVGLAQHYFPTVFSGATANPQKIEDINKAFTLLDTFLTNSEYVAGNNLTLADFSIVATVSTYDGFGHDLSPYKNVFKWYSKIKETAPSYEEINNKQVEGLRATVKNLKKK